MFSRKSGRAPLPLAGFVASAGADGAEFPSQNFLVTESIMLFSHKLAHVVSFLRIPGAAVILSCVGSGGVGSAYSRSAQWL